jgi:hypothetical protein
MSLLSCLALDLPKLITRLPPPWALFIIQNKISRTMPSGTMKINIWVRNESWCTTVLKVGLLPAFSSALTTVTLVSAGYCVMIWVLPSTSLVRVSRRRCSRSSIRAFLTLPFSIWAIATDVSTWV